MTRTERTILGIDPGLANTGWGIVEQCGPRLACTAYGCVSTAKDLPLAQRLRKIHEQMAAVIARFEPARPDHAADALAAAICYTTHEGFARRTGAACAAYDVPDRGILACGASAGKDRL